MRVLMICDDYWHPGKVPIDGVAPLTEKGFEFSIITNANDFTIDMLSQYPAVILSKCDEVSQADRQPWKTEAVQKGFVNYVENGGGLLIIHTGTVPSKNTETFERLMGCRFKGHPNACPVTVQSIKPHPVTNGVEMFCEVDEHYQLDIIAPDADVIIASYSPQQGEEGKRQEDPYHNTVASIQPAGYVRSQGKGRICVLTPGHNLPVWHNPQFQQTLSNALHWCGGQ